jgi:hypothetical protein
MFFFMLFMSCMHQIFNIYYFVFNAFPVAVHYVHNLKMTRFYMNIIVCSGVDTLAQQR